MSEKKLQKIMTHIVKHHDGLRSRFDSKEAFSKVEKNVNHNEMWSTKYVDLSNMNKDLQEQEISKLENVAQQGINISNGPLMKISYIKKQTKMSKQSLDYSSFNC